MTGLQLEPPNDRGLDQAHQARPSTDGLRGKARSALGRRRRGFPRPGAVLQEQAREGFLLAAVDRVGVAGDQIADLPPPTAGPAKAIIFLVSFLGLDGGGVGERRVGRAGRGAAGGFYPPPTGGPARGRLRVWLVGPAPPSRGGPNPALTLQGADRGVPLAAGLRPRSFTHEPDDLLGDGAGGFFGHIVPTASKHTTPHIRRD